MSENTKQDFPLFSFLARGKTFNPSKGKHVLELAESHRCEVNTLGILLACNSSMFLKVSQRNSF